MDAWFLEEMDKKDEPTKRLYKNQIEIRTETQLHECVVNFIRKRFPDVLLLPSLGETGNTEERRLTNWRKGYRSGAPDLLIFRRHPKYVGLAIEFKHPGGLGKTSENQEKFLQEMKGQGWMTIVSDSYDDIVLAVNDFVCEASIVCPECRKQCPSLSALGQHARIAHSEEFSSSKRRRKTEPECSEISTPIE